MATTKEILTLGLKGTVAGLTFYQLNGRTIVRRAKNVSVKKSNSITQQRQRIRFANCVALSKQLLRAGACCYTEFKEGITDYNAFMKLNIRACNVYLPREMNQCGQSMPFDGLVLSCGSLQRIDIFCHAQEARFDTSVRLGSLLIDSATTIAQLADAIVSCNKGICDLDTLVAPICCVKDVERPYPQFGKLVLPVNRYDFRLLSDLPLGRMLCSSAVAEGGFCLAIAVASVPYCVGATCFHVSECGRRLASTSTLCLLPGVTDRYGSREAFDLAVESYGGITTPETLKPDFSNDRLRGEFAPNTESSNPAARLNDTLDISIDDRPACEVL